MLAQNSSNPVLMELRSGTADLHKAIEGVMPFFRDDFDLEQYRHVLTKFYGFHASFEVQAARQLAGKKTSLVYDERRKLPALKRDLSFFYSEKEISQLPVCTDLPDYTVSAALFGGLYVIEGSSLGGQVISGHLQKMGIPSEARNYFFGYGAETGKMWKQFQAELSHQVQTPYEIQECVRAARETFLTLHRWFEQATY